MRSFLLLVFLKADFTSASLLSHHINTRALNSSVSLSVTPLLIFSWLQGKWTRLSNENQRYSRCRPCWMFIWCILAPSWAPVWIYTLFAFTLCQYDDDTVTNLLAKIVLWRVKVRLSNIRSPSCHIVFMELHLIIKQQQTITDFNVLTSHRIK